MFKKQQIRIFFLALILTGVFSGNVSGIEVQKYEIRWGTAVLGGNWATLGNAMLTDILKANPNLSGSTIPLGGTANVMGVYQGKLNIAISKADVLGDAWEGKEDFKEQGKIRNVRILASLFPEPSQFVVYADSGITTVPQLKGRKVTPGPKGGATEPLTRRIFEAYGMTTKDVQWIPLGYADGAEQMLDRHIDAILYGAMGYPAPTILNISSQRQIRLLPLSDDVIAKLVKNYRGVEPYILQAGSYKGVDYPVNGIASSVILIVRDEMPEDVAYNITKSIGENFNRYTNLVKAMGLGKVDEMGKHFGFPHHPGAIKYYKEKGWVK